MDAFPRYQGAGAQQYLLRYPYGQLETAAARAAYSQADEK